MIGGRRDKLTKALVTDQHDRPINVIMICPKEYVQENLKKNCEAIPGNGEL